MSSTMDLIEILLGFSQDPLTYLPLFLLYVILAAVFLPIPVEIGLFNSAIHPLFLIIVLAIGKGIGAFIVFYIGGGVRSLFKGRVWGSQLTKKILMTLERFVKKYGYYGLFIIMSIPLMVDSITLYLFSLLNPQQNGKKALTRNRFVLINILAGGLRGTIVLVIFYLAGIKLI